MSREKLVLFGRSIVRTIAYLCLLATTAFAQSGTFTPSGSMRTGRSQHTSTLLLNGKVLIVGGYNGLSLSSAEIYDTGTGTFNGTGSMAAPRKDFTATMLPNGKVLVAGGFSQISSSHASVLGSAELYDPATGVFTPTGSMASSRENFTAAMLSNGKVLVAGGLNDSGILASAELYDPATGTFSPTGSMSAARVDHLAVLLPNGKVLVAGGYTNGFIPSASAEIYDPATGTFGATASMSAARVLPTAAPLTNGKVLVSGGASSTTQFATVEAYDPVSGTFSQTGSMSTPRVRHTATVLPNGKVLVVDGGNSAGVLATAELYDPIAGVFSATGSTSNARFGHTATLLLSGRVLVVGGSNNANVFQASTELYTPNRPPIANAGPNQTIECAGRSGSIVTLNGSASSDPDGDSLTFTWKDEHGNVVGNAAIVSVTVPLGSHPFTLTVNDGHGNTASASVTITVRDTTPPALSVLLTPNVLWPADHKMVPVAASLQMNDVCDANPHDVLLSIISNEPDNGVGDGDTPNDIQGAALNTDDRSFLLRAERAAKGTGRIYTVTYRATDASGNARNMSAQVTVPVNQGQNK